MYNELEEVLRYIPQKINETNIIVLLRELATLYEEARNTPSPETSENIQSKYEEVFVAQSKIQPQDWDSTRKKIFEKLGASDLLGDEGYENINDNIDNFTNDPHGVSDYLNETAGEIEQFKTKIENATINLEELFEDQEKVPEGMKRVEIIFDKSVAVDTFDSMSEQAKEWNVILNALKLVTPNSTKDSVIWRISKASPTSIMCTMPPEQAQSMFDMVDKTLNIIVNLLVLTNYQNQTSNVPVSDEVKREIQKLIEKEKKKQIDEQVEKGVKEILAERNLKGSEKNQADVSLRLVLKKIYNFFVNGGVVNPIDIDKKESNKERVKNFKLTFRKTTQSLKTTKETLFLAEFTSKEIAIEKKIKEVIIEEKESPIVEEVEAKSKKDNPQR